MFRPSTKSSGYYFLVLSAILIFTPLGLAQEEIQKTNRGDSAENPVTQVKKEKDFIFLSPESRSRSSLENQNLTGLQEQARIHRAKGLEAQYVGQIAEAIRFYEKAIVYDPSYVELYNDLGVVYEMRGWQDKALDFYLQAIAIDPNYLPAYTNLAAIYEERGDLKTAAGYLQKRVRLGLPDDPWTQKARERLENIGYSVEDIARELKQEEVIDLIKEMMAYSPEPIPLAGGARDKKQKAIEYLNNAKLKLKRGNITAALNDLGIAAHLDPANRQIDQVLEEVRNELKYTESR